MPQWCKQRDWKRALDRSSKVSACTSPGWNMVCCRLMYGDLLDSLKARMTSPAATRGCEHIRRSVTAGVASGRMHSLHHRGEENTANNLGGSRYGKLPRTSHESRVKTSTFTTSAVMICNVFRALPVVCSKKCQSTESSFLAPPVCSNILRLLFVTRTYIAHRLQNLSETSITQRPPKAEPALRGR